jgi:hypothetical protein
MKMQFRSFVDYFLGIMLLVKLVFLITAVGHVITVRSKNPKIREQEAWTRFVSETTEMIFVFGMSFFLIYYFAPDRKVYVIQKETALLLFAYGIVMLFAAVKRYHLMPSKQATSVEKPQESSTSTTTPATIPLPLSG